MNPERGRKLNSILVNIKTMNAFQNMNPERGRKHTRPLTWCDLIYMISEHEPRKGTETLG